MKNRVTAFSKRKARKQARVFCHPRLSLKKPVRRLAGLVLPFRRAFGWTKLEKVDDVTCHRKPVSRGKRRKHQFVLSKSRSENLRHTKPPVRGINPKEFNLPGTCERLRREGREGKGGQGGKWDRIFFFVFFTFYFSYSPFSATVCHEQRIDAIRVREKFAFRR